MRVTDDDTIGRFFKSAKKVHYCKLKEFCSSCEFGFIKHGGHLGAIGAYLTGIETDQ